MKVKFSKLQNKYYIYFKGPLNTEHRVQEYTKKVNYFFRGERYDKRRKDKQEIKIVRPTRKAEMLETYPNKCLKA